MKFNDEFLYFRFLYFFHRILSVDANFTNLRVSGLSSYKVNSYRLVGLNVHLDLTWPNTTVNAAHYTVSNTSKVYGYDIYGDGEMKYLFLSRKFNPFRTNRDISIPIDFYS